MAPYISVSERTAASLMTWTMLVAHVRATEQCAEREARRQIGNAIADRRLFAWWADKPTIPPMPGSEFFWIRPRSTGSVPSRKTPHLWKRRTGWNAWLTRPVPIACLNPLCMVPVL